MTATASVSGGAATVLMLDDERSDLEQMRSLLAEAGYATVEFSDPKVFVQALSGMTCDCIVLDLRLPGTSGLEMLAQAQSLRPGVPVIMISGDGDLPTAVEAMRNGASDFVEKPVARSTLIDAVRRAIERARNPEPAARSGAQIGNIRQRLTPREAQILDLLLQGYRNKQVAFELGVSARTVEVHRANMMKRVGATNFAELIRMAVGPGSGAR